MTNHKGENKRVVRMPSALVKHEFVPNATLVPFVFWAKKQIVTCIVDQAFTLGIVTMLKRTCTSPLTSPLLLYSLVAAVDAGRPLQFFVRLAVNRFWYHSQPAPPVRGRPCKQVSRQCTHETWCTCASRYRACFVCMSCWTALVQEMKLTFNANSQKNAFTSTLVQELGLGLNVGIMYDQGWSKPH
jgi:hypothetical protein